MLGMIFSGVFNTGMAGMLFSQSMRISSYFPDSVSWLMIFLGADPLWKEQITSEIRTLVAKYTDALSALPLHKRLAAIPLSAWDDELPSIDLAIRETLRLTMAGTFLRRNVGKDVPVGDGVLRNGDFLAYLMTDAHGNPEVYTDPLRFDPGRFSAEREEDKKAYASFLGWGAGE